MDGTPTDCVLLAVGSLMPERPKFVFSGVNHGPNMGEDVLYSGTVSVAMEAVTLGIPGIAFSFASRNDELVKEYQGIIDSLVKQITDVENFPRDMVLNINLPGCPPDEVKGIKVTRLGSRYFTESITGSF